MFILMVLNIWLLSNVFTRVLRQVKRIVFLRKADINIDLNLLFVESFLVTKVFLEKANLIMIRLK